MLLRADDVARAAYESAARQLDTPRSHAVLAEVGATARPARPALRPCS